MAPFIHSLVFAGIIVLSLGAWLTTKRAQKHAASQSRARRFGAYDLLEKIGEGGMGSVYRARHRELERDCAVKLLPENASEIEVRRFEREARLTAKLNHPNTITVFDFGRADDGTLYYAMELCDGISLQELVERYGAQPSGRVIRILDGICAALGEAHAKGLVHRDVKPANVFLCRTAEGAEIVKLLDFGLVLDLEHQSESEDSNLVVGTPLYMSPESITAPESVGARSDLYSLGAVAYFLLSGLPVFDGNSVVEVCSQHLHATPERLSRIASRAIAEDLETLVSDCLAKNPLARPASASALQQRLSLCADSRDWSANDATAWWSSPRAFNDVLPPSGVRACPQSCSTDIGIERTVRCIAA